MIICRALSLQFKGHRREGWQLNDDGMFSRHPRNIFAPGAAVIADIAAAVRLRIGVDDLSIKSRLGDPEPVVIMYERRRVHDEGDYFAGARFSQERHDAVIGIVKIDPIETFKAVVLVPQGRLALVSVIEMLDKAA